MEKLRCKKCGETLELTDTSDQFVCPKCQNKWEVKSRNGMFTLNEVEKNKDAKVESVKGNKTGILGWLGEHLLPIIAFLLLVFAHRKFPYFYYQILRWVVCITFILYTVHFWEKVKFLGIISLINGVIYNPIIPIHMKKSSWFVFNVISAVILGIFILIPAGFIEKKISQKPIKGDKDT